MNGLIVINKEKGFTSRDVVNILSKCFHTKKIGHTGTLDPIAEGVLVCVVGKCTKLCDILASDEKEYIASMKFGVLTDTLDITGNILKTKERKISLEDIENAFKHFCGKYSQTVPIYSAVKINGKKLYDYARNNIEVTLPSREVEIKALEIINFKDNVLTFKTRVSKGTYIRSLIRDIGEYLDTYGTMVSLNRTKQGKFNIEDSFTLDEIKNNNYKLVELKEIFKDYPVIEVTDDELTKIQHGQEFVNNYNSDFICFSYKENIIAVYQVSKKDNKKIKPLILV